MRKIYVLGLALFAVVAFGAVGASSALALSFELAELLLNGVVPPAGTLVLSEEELLLEDKVLKGAIVCSVHYLEEWMGNSDLLVLHVLNLAGVEIGELTGESLLCRADTGSACEESATDIEVNPKKLAWLIELELDIEEKTPWELDFLVGYEMRCLSAGIKIEDSCEVAEGSGNEAVNGISGIEIAAGVTREPLGTCTLGGAESWVMEEAVTGLRTGNEGGVDSISTLVVE